MCTTFRYVLSDGALISGVTTEDYLDITTKASVPVGELQINLVTNVKQKSVQKNSQKTLFSNADI